MMNLTRRDWTRRSLSLFGVACCGLLAAFAPAHGAAQGKDPAAAAAQQLENSVVKVFSTMRNPDQLRPWTKQAPTEATGSGVVIEGRRILTNAHVVRYASQVQIQANQAGDKISAQVVAVAPGIDLAVLKLDDESFFATHAPLARAARMPAIKDAVFAYGYPTGGTTLSITKGIVSRIEFVPYSLSVSGLRIQIDAAINPGNSGGPAIAGDRMVGLAFSKLNAAQNIGYIIPNEEIELFLKDIADGRYDGKPALYADMQSLENPALRDYLKVDKTVQGIVVQRAYEEEGTDALKPWDIIMRIGATPIDNQGMIKVGDNLHVSFRYLVQNLTKDDHVPVTVLREGKPVTLAVPVARERRMLLQPDLGGEYPPYFIYGPLVFSRATMEFAGATMQRAGARGALGFMSSPLIVRIGEPPAFPGEEIVVITSPLFPHKLTVGYDNPLGSVVESVNGVKIRNLRHLVETLRDLKDPFVVLKFGHGDAETLVFPREATVAATEEILTDNGVRSQATADLLAVWTARTAN